MFERITIAGIGTVGSALQAYLNDQGLSPLVYDPPKGLRDVSVLNADVVFIAVPTPYAAHGFDLQYVDAVISVITSGAAVVIKSTILPGTTDRYQKKYPQLKMLFNPEFLTEKTAVHDFKNPTRQIMGYTDESRTLAEEILGILPHAPYQATMPAREAEMVKYMNNSFYALKVTFANQLYDLCKAMGIEYDKVAAAATTNEPWMGQNHWNVFFGGYRGYGGKCLPKDTRSLIQLGKEHAVDVSLLELMEKLNTDRMTQQKIKPSDHTPL